MVKAKEAIAICGFKTMSWNTITKFAGLMEKKGCGGQPSLLHRPDTLDTPGEFFKGLGNVMVITDLRQGNNRQPLEVLQLIHYFNCTDFKDILYAAFGPADDITANRCDLPIDNSQTIQEILMGLSRWFTSLPAL